jgi:hypothetical protein
MRQGMGAEYSVTKACGVRRAASDAFETVRAAFASAGGVEPARMFGSKGLKVGGKVFAMLVNDALVLKLPKERVAAIVEARAGAAFDPGHGRPMEEWVTITGDQTNWPALAREAHDFVRSLYASRRLSRSALANCFGVLA